MGDENRDHGAAHRTRRPSRGRLPRTRCWPRHRSDGARADLAFGGVACARRPIEAEMSFRTRVEDDSLAVGAGIDVQRITAVSSIEAVFAVPAPVCWQAEELSKFAERRSRRFGGVSLHPRCGGVARGSDVGARAAAAIASNRRRGAHALTKSHKSRTRPRFLSCTERCRRSATTAVEYS